MNMAEYAASMNMAEYAASMNMDEYAASLQSAAGAAEEYQFWTNSKRTKKDFLNGTKRKIRFI